MAYKNILYRYILVVIQCLGLLAAVGLLVAAAGMPMTVVAMLVAAVSM